MAPVYPRVSLLLLLAVAVQPVVAAEANADSGRWVYGVILSVFSGIISNFGVNVQKFTYNKEDVKANKANLEGRDYTKKSYFKLPGFWIGLVLIIVGAATDFVSLGFAAQSIIAPLSGGIALTANMVFASCWNKEAFSKRDFAATILIMGGIALAVIFGEKSDVDYTLDILISYFSMLRFYIYVAVVVPFMALMFFLICKIDPIGVRLHEAYLTYEMAASKSDVNETVSADEKVAACERKYAPWQTIHPFAYCALAGSFGAQNILFAKMVSVLLAQGLSVLGESVLPWVFLFCMCTSVWFQQHFMAKALRLFDALYVVPVFTFFFIFVSTIAGGLYFGEFSKFETLNWIMFPVGLVCTLTGVKLLSIRKQSRERSNNEVEVLGDNVSLMTNKKPMRSSGAGKNTRGWGSRKTTNRSNLVKRQVEKQMRATFTGTTTIDVVIQGLTGRRPAAKKKPAKKQKSTKVSVASRVLGPNGKSVTRKEGFV